MQFHHSRTITTILCLLFNETGKEGQRERCWGLHTPKSHHGPQNKIWLTTAGKWESSTAPQALRLENSYLNWPRIPHANHRLHVFFICIATSMHARHAIETHKTNNSLPKRNNFRRVPSREYRLFPPPSCTKTRTCKSNNLSPRSPIQQDPAYVSINCRN